MLASCALAACSSSQASCPAPERSVVDGPPRDSARPSSDHDRSLSADRRTDARIDRSTDGGITCNKQCDCPYGTVCTIDHACYGTAGVQRCDTQGQCPCGQACVDGWCPPFVGSLAPCKASCECGPETCIGGKCVATGQGSGGTCQATVECAACPGTICLLPDSPAFCGPPGSCMKDAHCVFNVASGQQCVCAGGAPHDPCLTALGHCAPIPGQAFLGAGFTGASNPSGGCMPSERSSITISGVTGPVTAVLVYVEGNFNSGTFPASLELFGPGGMTPAMFPLNGIGAFALETPLSAVPSTVEEIWTLCNYVNPASAYTVAKWGLYLQ